MKNILLILYLAFYFNSNSQTIPNGGFESWYKIGPSSMPSDWKIREGVALKVDNVLSPNEVGLGTSSMLFINIIDKKYGNILSVLENSFECKSRPNFMSYLGFYNSFVFKPFYVDVLFYKANGDTVGFTHCPSLTYFFDIMYHNIKQSPFQYAKQEYAMNYFNADLPDSCKITIHSAINENMVDHSYVYFDDFDFHQEATLTLKNELFKERVNQINIYPNPTSGHFKIEYKLLESTLVKIELSDLSGKIVARKEEMCRPGINNFIFTPNNLSNGYYFLKITHNNSSFFQKISIFHY